MGYVCVVPGETFTIKPIGSPAGTPMSYFISILTKSKTGNSLSVGQLILGKYAGKTSITCTLKSYPFTVQTVILNRVSLYGTSNK